MVGACITGILDTMQLTCIRLLTPRRTSLLSKRLQSVLFAQNNAITANKLIFVQLQELEQIWSQLRLWNNPKETNQQQSTEAKT